DTALTLVNALTASVTRDSLLNLVYVGRARVRLDRGDRAGAAADAALVTAGFEFFVTRSVDDSTRWNDAWTAISEFGNSSVDPQYRNLTVGGTADPRVVVVAGPGDGRRREALDGGARR